MKIKDRIPFLCKNMPTTTMKKDITSEVTKECGVENCDEKGRRNGIYNNCDQHKENTENPFAQIK